MSKQAVQEMKEQFKSLDGDDPMITMVSMKDLSGVTGGLMFGAAEKWVLDDYDGKTNIVGSCLSGQRDRGRPVVAVAHLPYGEEA